MTGTLPFSPMLSLNDRAKVAKLLGDEKWCPVVEQLMADRQAFLQAGQPRPFAELSGEVAKEIRRGLQRGKKLSGQVLDGKAEVADLKQWLACIEQTWTGGFLAAFDRVHSGYPLPVRGSGARGKRKSPKPEPLPEPTSFPLNFTGGIPSMAEAAFRAQIGRIDLPALTNPTQFRHGSSKMESVRDEDLAERYSWQTDLALDALKASYLPRTSRRSAPNTNALDTALVIRLAYVWLKAHGKWPKRQHRGDLGRDAGPFVRLATVCLRPFRPIQPESLAVEEIVRKVVDRLPPPP